MCRSACENYFISCGQPEGLKRCGETKFHNGYDEEIPKRNDTSEKYDLFTRGYFPGQPFRDMKMNWSNWKNATDKSLAMNEGRGYQPIIVCTPSLRDGASSLRGGIGLWGVVALTTALLLYGSCSEVGADWSDLGVLFTKNNDQK